jgi:WD40 repeat protein
VVGWTRGQGEDGVADGTSEYDAFISYSHTLDGALACALQTGLERSAKPWYRPRALRVFRDTTNLAANPDLWSSIETALASSAWLVLMASPSAAQSKWVNREVAWWLGNRSPQRLLVVLTEGEFAWEDDAGHRDGAVAALPPALRGVFVGEPRWVDLRWLHNVDQVDQSNPRLRECVADVAAAVREVPKDALVGEHIRQHRRTMRLARGGVTALVLLLIAAVGAALVAVNQRNQAREQRDTAIFNQITAEADRLRNTDVSLAAQLDVTAYRMRPTPDVYTALLTAGNVALSIPPLAGHTNDVIAVAFSRDGHTLVTGSADRTARLWNVTVPGHPTPLGTPLTGHTRPVSAVVFSPDGRTLATGSVDGIVQLWDVADPEHPRSLGPLPGTAAVLTVAFSPNGHTLAAGSADSTARLWNVTDPGHPTPLGAPLTGHTNRVLAVAFSPDGRSLATGSYDKTVRLWNVADPAHPVSLGQPVTGHTYPVSAVAFSPDGHTLATGSYDKTARLWNVTDPAHLTSLGLLIGHANSVMAVAFSPDGHILATGSTDNTARLWNVTDPAHPTSLSQQPLAGHTDWVSAVAFSPDGHTLATGSADDTARLWNIPHTLTTGHTDRMGTPWPPPATTRPCGCGT